MPEPPKTRSNSPESVSPGGSTGGSESTSYKTPPGGLPGKGLTVTLLLVLAISGAMFYWVTTAYSDYNAARRETDRTWRAMAVELDVRYRHFDNQFEQAFANKTIDAEVAGDWRRNRDAFARTAQSTRQIEEAQKLEDTIEVLSHNVVVPAVGTAHLHQLADLYEQAAGQQRTLGRSAGSRLLKSMLNLPEPEPFRLAQSQVPAD